MSSALAAPAALPPDGQVHAAVADGVATVRFGHPKGNSLPGSLLRELARTVAELGQDDAARVIVLRSEGGGAFCAGASFAELTSIADAARGKEFFMGFARLILAMRSAPKFVLARVHGRAVGGGVGVVAASDYALAHVDASVKLSELAVGIGPFVVGPVIERKVGLGGLQALAVDALAARLAASNPAAMALMKRTFWEGTEHWDALLERRAEMSGTLVLSDFTRRAIASFGAR